MFLTLVAHNARNRRAIKANPHQDENDLMDAAFLRYQIEVN